VVAARRHGPGCGRGLVVHFLTKEGVHVSGASAPRSRVINIPVMTVLMTGLSAPRSASQRDLHIRVKTEPSSDTRDPGPVPSTQPAGLST
jgi:hypothetical protein